MKHVAAVESGDELCALEALQTESAGLVFVLHKHSVELRQQPERRKVTNVIPAPAFATLVSIVPSLAFQLLPLMLP